MAVTVDDILIPKPRRRRRRRQPPKSSKFGRILLGLAVMIIILGAIFSFVNVGGSIILELAKNYLSENMNINLTAESITGNPIKGYRLNNFELSDSKGQKILSAGFLAGRVNFAALLRGKIRLAEISLGGMSMDIDTLIQTARDNKIVQGSDSKIFYYHSLLVFPSLTASPAFADEPDSMPDIPLDRFSIVESRFSSEFGVLSVERITADLQAFDVDINASLNGIPITGKVDMGESVGLTGVNKADISFGKGKILATGGLIDDNLDLHASIEDLDLSEITALYPALLKSDDFDGTAKLNVDITGKPDSPKVAGIIDYKGAKLYGFPVERANANITYANYRAGLSNIQASIFSIPIQGEVAVALRPGEKLSVFVKLDGKEANLEGLDEIFGVPELKRLSGKVTAFNANISGYIDTLSGIVNFTAPKIAYADRAMTNIRAQMKLSKSDTAQVDGKFTFEGAQGYLQGQIASVLARPKLNLTAKIVDLDIKKVQDMIPDASDYKLAGKVTASVSLKGTTDNPTITGSVNSQEFSGFDQTITKPSINFTFANQTLTLSKTEGTLNGMPINLSGTIGPLPSENPNLNINATITMTPAALKEYVPDITQYNLKGKINAGLKITGSVNNPAVSLLASSPNLQAMDMVTAKDMELTTALGGDLTKLDKINLNISAKSLTASGATFTGLNAKIDKNGDKITLGTLNAKSGQGTISGSGSAAISGKSPLDFSFKFTNLELAPLAAASGVALKGSLSGTLKVSGPNTNPAITLTANVPTLNAEGFTLSGLVADVSGNMENMKVNRLRADVEGAEISASGTVKITPALAANITLKGDGIRLERLLKDNPELKDKVTGTAALTFTLTGTGTNINGKGSITSPAVKAFGISLTGINLPLSYSGNTFASSGGSAKFYGGTLKNNLTFDVSSLKFTDNFTASGVDIGGLIKDVSPDLKDITGKANLTLTLTGTGANVTAKGTLTSPAFKAYGFELGSVNLPFSYSGNNFASSGGTAKLYGGTLKNTLTFSTKTMKFTDNIDASGVDVNALIQAAAGGLDGKITGAGKLTMKVNGTAGDKVTYSGSGNFSMGSGAITGFKWLGLLTRLHGTNGIRYASVNAPLTLQTGKLIIKSGSIANAPKNDPMYKYAKLTQDGAVNFSGKEATIYFMTESSINYQLINAIQGGGKGGLEALFKGGVSSLQDGLKAFLSGGVKGAEQSASTGDFRTVTLKISGKAASPSFSGLKIGASTLKPATQTTTTSPDKKPETQSIKERIIDRAVDAIVPGAKPQTTTTPAQPAQTTPQTPATKQQIQDRVREGLRKGIEQGLGGLFK